MESDPELMRSWNHNLSQLTFKNFVKDSEVRVIEMASRSVVKKSSQVLVLKFPNSDHEN